MGYPRHSISPTHSHSKVKRRMTPPASPTRSSKSRAEYSSAGSSKQKYAPTSLASELSKHRKAKEMREAQMMAAKLRQSREHEMKMKREPLSPDRKSLEPVRKEPEYSRKERLQDARESNIVVKVENVQHNHKNLAENRLRETDSPRKTPVEKVQEKVLVMNEKSDRGSVKSNISEAKDSPYENVSDMEPSPAPVR